MPLFSLPNSITIQMEHMPPECQKNFFFLFLPRSYGMRQLIIPRMVAKVFNRRPIMRIKKWKPLLNYDLSRDKTRRVITQSCIDWVIREKVKASYECFWLQFWEVGCWRPTKVITGTCIGERRWRCWNEQEQQKRQRWGRHVVCVSRKLACQWLWIYSTLACAYLFGWSYAWAKRVKFLSTL